MFGDYATSCSVWLLLAVKLKPFSWNVLEQKKTQTKQLKRGKVTVSVGDVLFVSLVLQTVITTAAFFNPGSIDQCISFLNLLAFHYLYRSVRNFPLFF